MVYSIVIGSINLTRLKLGDTFKLAPFFLKLNKIESNLVNFEQVKKLLSDYLYIYSFKRIDDIIKDLITKVVKSNSLLEFNVIEDEEIKKFFNFVDQTISVRSIDFEMFGYLNKYIWPNIIKEVFNYVINDDDNEGLEILLRIPCNIIYNYYSKYVKDDKVKNTLYARTLMEVNATFDIVTWLMSNRIAFPRKDDMSYNDGFLEIYIRIKNIV